MIDDYASAMALLEQMKAHVPIPVYPGTGLLRSLKDQGIHLKSRKTIYIQDVLYIGDEGGILCALSGIDEEGKTANLCSLTHVRVNARHPLAKAMKQYQRERTKRLMQQPGYGQTSSFEVTPDRPT